MLLADSAQAIHGKLYILGGGWSTAGPGQSSSAMAIKIEVPWDEANRKHRLRLELVDEDNKPVMAPKDIGGSPRETLPVQIDLDFEVGRPSGVKAGTPLDFSTVINWGPLPLQPNGRYLWRLYIDDQREEDWYVAFSTRSLD